MRPRAFALIYQMLVTIVVLMLVGAILISTRYQVFSSQTDLSNLRAQYAAEAGVSMAIAQLSDNRTWAGPFNRQPLPGGGGCYSLRFAAPAAAGPLDSVNNLNGDTAVDSYLGPGTVPPHTALLVVEGWSGVHHRVVEAFIAGGGQWIQDAALASAGKIDLRGRVYIDGYASLRSVTPVDAGIHSNHPGGADAIRWQEIYGTDELSVSGKLTAVSSDPAAIQTLGSNVSVGGMQNDAPYRRLPNLDVSAMVNDYSGSPGAPLPATGAVVLNGGDHYYSGNRTINGDVELKNGARLVIDGNLTINGSVKGEGAVLVDGNTSLYGDSQVIADQSRYVSILSSGHVVLSGFNGTEYLQSLANGEPVNGSTPRGNEAAELWTDVQDAMTWMQNYLAANPDPDSWNDNQMDSRSAVLAQGTNAWGTGAPASPFVHTLPNAPRRNSLGLLRARISGASPTQVFLRDRMQRIDDLLRAADHDRGGYMPPPPLPLTRAETWWTSLNGYLTNPTSWDPNTAPGLFDMAQSLYINRASHTFLTPADILSIRNQALPEMNRQIDQFNYNRIGAAQFRGLVYARGGVLADNEVTILGSMVAVGDPAVSSLNVNGVTLATGQVMLSNSSRFTYVRDMFENGVGELVDLGVLGVKNWRLR